MLRFTFFNEDKPLKSLGKTSSNRLQSARLKLAKEWGKEAHEISRLFLGIDKDQKDACHDLSSLVVARSLFIAIPSAANTFKDSNFFNSVGNSLSFEQPEIISVSRDFS